MQKDCRWIDEERQDLLSSIFKVPLEKVELFLLFAIPKKYYYLIKVKINPIMNLGLSGKNAVVTGGSKGIGKSIAKALAAEGANVAICARGKDALQATAKEITELGVNVLASVCDVGDRKALHEFLNSAREKQVKIFFGIIKTYYEFINRKAPIILPVQNIYHGTDPSHHLFPFRSCISKIHLR
jgi:hypothetical protein